MLLRVTNIQRGCVYDGPGVRTTVFLKGCSLHCPWCCNPETISYEKQWFIDDRKCVLLQGQSSHICDPCERRDGTRSIHSCPYRVAEPTSHDYTTEEILAILLKDKELFKESHGGVTFSGGEPLLQAKELSLLFDKLKELKIHIAIETTLVASEQALGFVLPYIDYYIIDMKLQPQMKLSDKSYLLSIKKMLSLMREKQKCFRMVFVDEVFDNQEKVLNALQLLNIDAIELLLYHNLGENKYARLAMKNELFFADAGKAALFRNYLVNNGIDSSMLSV